MTDAQALDTIIYAAQEWATEHYDENPVGAKTVYEAAAQMREASKRN